ncbi:MAG: purine-binding chemotaxis protein CheW [Deltaproteobacteria bacterium]|nr:purine-binding chemotaxis protein CheW [Deltaproteobacteria bacterium]
MSKVLQMVGFNVGREFFGVNIGAVKEIIRVPDITPVPDTPEFVEGVVNLRGRIVPVIDMRRRVGIQSAERNRGNRILVLELAGKMVGLIVDSASDIIKISEDAIEPPPDIVSSVGAEYVTGVGKLMNGLVVLLDLARLLSAEEMRKVEGIQRQISPGNEKGDLQAA